MNRIRKWTRTAGGLTGCALWIAMSGPTLAAPEEGPPSEELTVITSEKLTYDAERRFIVFERNVVVNDPTMNMTADHLTVRLDENSEVQSLLAVGNVVIRQEDRTAWAQRATYDVAAGVFVLDGEPRVMRGRDLLAGDRITFWRDEQRMICEPHARLVIYPGTDGVRETLTRDR